VGAKAETLLAWMTAVNVSPQGSEQDLEENAVVHEIEAWLAGRGR